MGLGSVSRMQGLGFRLRLEGQGGGLVGILMSPRSQITSLSYPHF